MSAIDTERTAIRRKVQLFSRLAPDSFAPLALDDDELDTGSSGSSG